MNRSRFSLYFVALSMFATWGGFARAQDSYSRASVFVDGKRVSNQDWPKVSRDIAATLKEIAVPGAKPNHIPESKFGRIFESFAQQGTQAKEALEKVIFANRVSSIASARTFQSPESIQQGLERIQAVRDGEAKWTQTEYSLVQEVTKRIYAPGFQNRLLQSINETLKFFMALNTALDLAEEYLEFAQTHHPSVPDSSNFVHWPNDELPQAKTYVAELNEALLYVGAVGRVHDEEIAEQRRNAAKASDRLHSMFGG